MAYHSRDSRLMALPLRRHLLLLVASLIVLESISDVQCSIHKHYDHFQRNNKYIEGVADALEYFTEFGYIDPATVQNGSQSMSMEDLRDVIMDFQQVCSLKQTGRLDPPTMELINTPRCGNQDIVVHHHRHGQPGSASGTSTRPERYVLFGSKWQTKVLTYKITQYTRQSVSPAMIASQIRRAFQIWENEINLIFIESTADEVDIEVKFQIRAHGDNFPFEGTYTLAHAFYPGTGLGGDVHFNDEVGWNGDPNFLLYTAVHEIGHSLGLRHSTIQGSIMFPHYMFSGTEVTLHEDDIAGAQELYGSRSMHSHVPSTTAGTSTRTPILFNSPPRPRPTTALPTPRTERPFHRKPFVPNWPSRFPTGTAALPSVTPKPPTSPPRTHAMTTTATVRRTHVHTDQPKTADEAEEAFWGRRNSELCQNGIVDAVVDLHNGTVLLFRRDYVLPLNAVDGKLVAGRIQSIQSAFHGRLPADIEAAFTRDANKKSYYFKGNEYWRATGTKVDEGYPKLIGEHFPGIPNKLDAAFEWSNHQMYFFKGEEYWRFNTKSRPPVASHYPSKITEKNWEGAPSYDLDAVFRLVGDPSSKHENGAAPGYTYFFRSGRYWKFDDREGKVPTNADPPYPRDARVWLFGCTDISRDLSSL